MTWDNKVIWSEGLFLQPQHFQQQDRYLERLMRERTDGLRPSGWGLRQIEVDHDMLSLGKFGLSSASGVMADGTPFSIPDDADHPPPLDIPENTRDAVIYLTLPVRQSGGKEVEKGGSEETVARFSAVETEIQDSIVGSRSQTDLEVGRLRLRYALASQELADYVCLGLARIVEIRSDKQIILDEGFIPSVMDIRASALLSGFVSELQGLLHHRGEALAARVSQSGTKGVAEIADFLMLQTVNRYEPLVEHLVEMREIHPERFFSTCLQVAGDLASFTTSGKRPPAFVPYRHDSLAESFAPVIASLRQSLSAVLEQTAIPIPLEERKYGVRVAVIADKRLLAGANFVLAVRADVQVEKIRRHFPHQAKLGPVEKIRELVNVALPGIEVRPLPVAPRQIPYHAGVTYFELDRSSQYWRALAQSGGLAIHVAGDFPNLDMELWAIRGT